MRPINFTLVQIAGFACIVSAAWAIRDGWYAVGAVGVALVAAAELVDRRHGPD